MLMYYIELQFAFYRGFQHVRKCTSYRGARWGEPAKQSTLKFPTVLQKRGFYRTFTNTTTRPW